MARPPTIYLDHAASAPTHPAVVEAMVACMLEVSGNASAVHRAGVRAALRVEAARTTIAQRMGADPKDLLFTSGGTESNNLAIKGLAMADDRRAGHIVTTAIEHPSVLAPIRWLQARGFEVTILSVDQQGFVCPDDLRRALRADTILVSIIHGNNELGTVQSLTELGQLCREAAVPFHVDACQSFTKVPLDLAALTVDLVSINAHKLYGPQGVGALWVRPGLRLEPGLHGGGQEAGLRSGTINTAGIVGFAAATNLATPARLSKLRTMRASLVSSLAERLPAARLNGPAGAALPHVVSLTFPGQDGKALFQALNRRGFQLSVGSACKAGSTDPSSTLLATGMSETMARSTLRISPGYDTREEQIEGLLTALEELLPQNQAP